MKLKLALFILPFFHSAGFALEELEKIDHLSPMDGPGHRAIGWEWHYIDHSGEPGHMRKVSGTDTTATYYRTDGCVWTRPVRGFAPAYSWSNCPSSGKSKVEFKGGDIWPLRVGNKFTYKLTGSSSILGSWNGERACEVKYMVRIKIVSGQYDTFKVVCEERWGTRSWWLAPEVGTAVAYRQKTFLDDLVLEEMTKIVP